MHNAVVARLPLEAFPVIDTTDPEALRQTVFGFYPSARAFEVPDRAAPFAARAHDCALAQIGVSYGHYDAAVRFGFGATGEVRQRFCLAGTGETRVGRVAFANTPHTASTIPPDAEFDLAYKGGYRQIVVRFDVAALTRKLAALTGVAPARPIKFEPAVDRGSPEGERLWRSMRFLVRELDLAGDRDRIPMLAELEQVLMLSFLTAAPHNHRALLARATERPAPWQVRRAEDYICANLDKALTVESIAEATGASARAIFKAFNESRGYSPMAFAKMRRLERAHALLRAPDAATTVTGVALACGFLNQGHFARDYRARFGELPSETLRGAR
jgi:AraC-like DNA-binding protein